MKAWARIEAIERATKSKGLLGYVQTAYNKAVPCQVQFNSMNVIAGTVGIEISHSGWGNYFLVVPMDSVDMEVHMKSTSIPIKLFLQLRRYFSAVKD